MSSRAFAHSSAALQSLSKEIGFDFSTLEKNGEAGRLWDALNDLSNDPVAYNNFMAKQLQHLDSSKDGEVTLNEQSAESAMPPFVPLSGFVVKAFTKPDGDKLFVNISHHETAVPKPVDDNGNAVTESCQNFVNLQVPLLISKVRDRYDGNHKKSLAVDVVVNSWCMTTCSTMPSFKTELVTLALNSLEEEHSLGVDASGWKILKLKYKGGIGEDGTGPRPFEDSQVPKSMKMEPVTESPSDLLRCKEEQEIGQSTEHALLQIPQLDKSKKKLIQEIPSNHSSEKKPPLKSKSLAEKGPVIKPGFLNARSSNKNKSLSPIGSTGDGSLGAHGSHAKLMSKCKVVDTASAPTTSGVS